MTFKSDVLKSNFFIQAINDPDSINKQIEALKAQEQKTRATLDNLLQGRSLEQMEAEAKSIKEDAERWATQIRRDAGLERIAAQEQIHKASDRVNEMRAIELKVKAELEVLDQKIKEIEVKTRTIKRRETEVVQQKEKLAKLEGELNEKLEIIQACVNKLKG